MISIHTPRVGRDMDADANWVPEEISIHTPRVGRDVPDVHRVCKIEFQSTRPVWGVTLLTMIERSRR